MAFEGQNNYASSVVSGFACGGNISDDNREFWFNRLDSISLVGDVGAGVDQPTTALVLNRDSSGDRPF
jgi:hypothetical protein